MKTYFTLLILTLIFEYITMEAAGPPPQFPSEAYDITVHVTDSKSNSPLKTATVILKKGSSTGAYMFTDAAGSVAIRNIPPGNYILDVSFKEYVDYSDTILIDKEHTTFNVALVSELNVVKTEGVTVSAYKIRDIQILQMATGAQLFESGTYHASPTNRMSDLIQQNVLGAVKAPTGEVHIRGYHGEYSYYLDGVPIPLGVFGGLNEIVDPRVIEKMTLLTGGFPAEYGGQTAAVMDIQTVIPSGHFHLDFSAYSGSFLVFNGAKPFSQGNEVPYGNSGASAGDTLGGRIGPFRAVNSNGQAISLSNHIGPVGYFLSASRQETDRRVDQPVPTLYNDHGTDYFLYGKLDYLLTDNDYLTLNLNYGDTRNQVPFDPVSDGFIPASQKSYNAFQTFSWYHTFSSEQNREKNLFIGAYARQGGLNYEPSAGAQPNFRFAGDSTIYLLNADRKFNTLGLRTKYDYRFSEDVVLNTGMNLSITSGKENFTSKDSLNRQGPSILTDYTGSDFGVFTQGQFEFYHWFRIDAGIRYDQHVAPDMNIQRQVSPRLKLNFFIDENNTFYLYYGKLFMPANIENIRSLSSKITSGGSATLPEKDDFFEISFLHSFANGFTVKTAGYYKYASPGMDDQTIGSSAVKTAVNIQTVRIKGIELGVSYTSTSIPITGFLNTALIHAYGSGAITGGFLPISSAGTATDLDHDQRLSISAEINYQPQDYFLNLAFIYGSGLTNGNPDNIEYKTGLFDFNREAHVPPYAIVNLSAGYTFHIGGENTIEPSLYINNLFDSNYIMKGAYFSGASWGERRNIVLKIGVHL